MRQAGEILLSVHQISIHLPAHPECNLNSRSSTRDLLRAVCEPFKKFYVEVVIWKEGCGNVFYMICCQLSLGVGGIFSAEVEMENFFEKGL